MNTGGYKYKIIAKFDGLVVNLTMDIATGDIITPRAMEYNYKMLFEDRNLELITYNIETIIAEKLQALVARGNLNGRMKDYYDLYYLLTYKKDSIDEKNLKLAIERTFNKRNTELELISSVLQDIAKSDFTKKIWDNYASKHEYAKDLKFEDVIKVISKINID